MGRSDQAESAFRAALAIQDKLVADFPTVPDFRADLAISYGNLGSLLHGLGHNDQAVSACRTAMIIWEKLVAEFPGVLDYVVGLGGMYGTFGDVISDRDGVGAALEWYRKGFQVLGEVLTKDNWLVKVQEALGEASLGQADALDMFNRRADARMKVRAILREGIRAEQGRQCRRDV